jgi:hypothetical protein
VTWAGSGIAAHSRPSWLSAECRPAAKGHLPCMRASLRPPPPSARSPAIRPAQHLSVASATVGADSATVGTNSATDMRVSAKTAMERTMVVACVTMISEPLGKLPNWLVRWLEEIILRRSRRDRAPYSIWCGQRMLVAAGGNTTDFQFIEAEIPEPASREFTELAYDRTFAGEIVRSLQDEGLPLVEFGQGFRSMAGRRGIQAPPDWPGASAWRQPDRGNAGSEEKNAR